MSSNGAMKASPSIFPGATISGRFRIDRLLGRGAMGAVWRARHLALDLDVAVKFIDGALRHEKGHRLRFVHEAQSAARIASPHVVNVLDFGEDEGRLYLAMEYLDGEDLGRFLERNGRLSLAVTARVVAHACRGLSKAHSLGIAHRDIKPENLFLCGDEDDDGFVLKILDFGVAKAAGVESLSGTSAGQLIGSPVYMSPEQARGLRQLDGRSDLFSLAVVAYHCLTGRTPFLGDSLADLLLSIIGSDPEPVSAREPGLPRALDAWFERALQKEPARRFQSAKEMAQAFELAIGARSSSSPDYGTSATVTAGASLSPSSPDESVVNRNSSTRVAINRASVSNDTGMPGLPAILAQLADVSHVLGVGLVSPELLPLAHHSSMGLSPVIFGEIAGRVRDALKAFENIESAHGRSLSLYFQSATVHLRWIDGYSLIAVGTEQVHPAMLTVSLNTAASKLQTSAEQTGGAAAAFRTKSPPVIDVPQTTQAAPPPRPSDPFNERTYRGVRVKSEK
jgi:eukaryotic-like serine/threonine-protein kinase